MRTPYKTMAGGTYIGEPRRMALMSREEKIEIIWANARPHRATDGNRRQILMPGTPPKWRDLESLTTDDLDGMMPEPPKERSPAEDYVSERRRANAQASVTELQANVKQLEDRVITLERLADLLISAVDDYRTNRD